MIAIPPALARSTLDAAPDAVLIMDTVGSIWYINRRVAALFGYGRDEIIGESIETLMPERYRAQYVGHREQYISNLRRCPVSAPFDLFGRRRDGTEFPLEISLSPIEDVARTLIAASIRDVTDHKRVEAELVVARETAEAMRELAERANQAKSRFLATASHDLRQPLQTLSLLNGTLRRIVTYSNAAEALAQQDQAIAAMSRLLNALLDISKLESGAIKPEPTDFTVATMFAELRLEFASIAANKGLQLQIEPCEQTVHSDPSLVEQILRNLLSNAVKYTREGWVRLRCLHEAALVRIEILDTGVGIPAAQLPFIFDEFYQVGVATHSSRDGYGLGLAIVQRLVKLLAITLDVRSEVGQGTAFSLILPAGNGHDLPAHGQSPGSPLLDSRHTRDTRVLLVEDNESVQRAMCLLLELDGYQVTPVASLAEALRHVREGKGVDLLVSDYHLSDSETGIQVIAALREVLGSSLPAVLTTGDTSSAIKLLPRDPHLRITSKPIQAEELLALIRELLGDCEREQPLHG